MYYTTYTEVLFDVLRPAYVHLGTIEDAEARGWKPTDAGSQGNLIRQNGA